MTFKTGLIFPLAFFFALAARGADKDEMIDGTWFPAEAEIGGQKFPEEVRKIMKLEVKDGKYTVTVGKGIDRGTIKLNPAAKPQAMDITGTEGPNKGKTHPAIYERKGDTLRICYDLSGKGHPKEFKSTAGTQLFLVTYKLEKP